MQAPVLLADLGYMSTISRHLSYSDLKNHKFEQPKPSMVMLPAGYASHKNRVVPQVERQHNAWRLAGEVKLSRTERIGSRPSAAAGSHHETSWE